MPRLLRDGVDVGSAEVAATRRARSRGLLGRDGLDGVLVLPGTRGVHTLGMRFAIDVAFVDRHGHVLDVVTMRPGRLGRPRLRARTVLEAEEGALRRLGVRRGSTVAVAADEHAVLR